MLPSAVAREARENLLDYLRTTYGLRDEAFEAALFEFLAGSDGMFRGPYLDVRLPFRSAGSAPLPLEIAPKFTPYAHQLRAFQRLHSYRGHQPQHTLVTTGTGSGKTECFLYPILDHCWRMRQQGKPGIKAILLYPMNALASDQARRIAKELWDDPRLKGTVTAGLYVGGKGSHSVADREHLIDDRRVLRQAPPDILLTNYKMLDFLLLRPEDRSLWEQNQRDTLRFLVLDELHTYDGAQGSDVACLLRRLKARLDTPQGGLCCIGTSATIGQGDEASKQRLVDFAGEVFDEVLLTDAVITEDRLGIEEALGREVDPMRRPGTEGLAALDPLGQHPDDWLRIQLEHWVGAQVEPVELGRRLRRHPFLRRLLEVLGGKVRSVDEVAEGLAERELWFAGLSRDERALVLDSFVGLISHARGEGQGKAPFLHVQVQLWLREIRQLLRAVDVTPRFKWRSELGGHAIEALTTEELETRRLERYLPMVRCRECGCVGLASVKREGEAVLRDDRHEREIGKAWLHRSPTSRAVMFGHHADGDPHRDMLCPACLTIHQGESCGCQGEYTPPSVPIRLWGPTTDDAHPRFKPTCPECDAEDGLVFLASRAASLLSVSVSHLYQTEYNEDRKLLAFVDAVQDASHRAGFFGARTYRFNLRALIQEMVQAAGGRLPMTGVGARLLDHTAVRLGSARFAVPVLVPEDLRQHPDYEAFLAREDEAVPVSLRHWLSERLDLEVAFEFGYSVRAGRSLEKTGCSTLALDPEAFDAAVRSVTLQVNQDGLLGSAVEAPAVALFLAGLVQRTRLRGGVLHPLLGPYVRSGGNRFMLSKRFSPMGPVFARDSVLPRFLQQSAPTGGKRSAFDAYAPSERHLNWYADWAARCLGVDPRSDGIHGLYDTALRALVKVRLFEEVQSERGRSIWGLREGALAIVDDVCELTCGVCAEVTRFPSDAAAAWEGAPCLRYRCTGRYGGVQRAAASFYTRIFREGRVARVFAHEHTGLLERQHREALEERFKAGTSADGPNLLVCTPTLEMGIDIGDLSAVLLCSVPPTTASYLQRIGRAGRSTGNALCITLANTRPHDLYFHADPPAMMAGAVEPPGCFLDAPEMLKRQLVAFGMDAWARVDNEVGEIPHKTSAVLGENSRFPAAFLGYYDEHRDRLLADFLGRFEQRTLGTYGREELEVFARGDQVRERVQHAFEEVRLERANLKRLEAAARKRREAIAAEPELAAGVSTDEVAELQSAEYMLNRLYRELGARYPLQVLTDAGVLPNYAFPEAGVELDSVVQSGEGANRRYDARQYQRPASAAIRELAPFNTFYAEGRRVQVDEIDLGSSAHPLMEEWRLCPACSHAERVVDGGEVAPTCPACGSIEWSDVAQRRQLVYFRRSRSLANRLEVATVDDGEEREQQRYQTHDLIDVRPENRRGARLMPNLPFGFELLSGLRLRELNFGLESKEGLVVAGHSVNEDGFVVCRDCGRVRSEDPDRPLRHAPTCRAKRPNQPERLENVYLYREVQSEAIRILLPVAHLDLETQRASFRAALQLGLRRRFGGRAPHLQTKTMQEPSGSGHRHFIVLFDAVPGGTGYLADLWHKDALLDVLADVRDALLACACRAAGEDGCYRCLFAYQGQRELEQTSSRRASEMLDAILESRSDLVDADSLSEVTLDKKLESELEERFLRALLARARKYGEARRFLHNGEPRWEVTVGDHRWEIIPQMQLGPSEGVFTPCRPDFVLRPRSSGGDPRGVAVFCDGFEYHVQPNAKLSRLGDDVWKRSAVMHSSKYLVWSVVWQDVVDFEVGTQSVDSLIADRTRFPGLTKVLERWGLRQERELAALNSFELLWRWLASPSAEDWAGATAARGAEFLLEGTTLAEDTWRPLRDQLATQPEVSSEPANPTPVAATTKHFARLQRRGAVAVLATLPTVSVASSARTQAEWTLRLFDSHEERRSEGFREQWRLFLQASNFLQFSAALTMVSTEDLLTHGEPFVAPQERAAARAAEATGPFRGLGLLDDELPVAQAVFDAFSLVPVVGFELQDERGRCVAEAALAWESPKVAVVRNPGAREREALEREGWRIFELDEHVIGAVIDAVGRK